MPENNPADLTEFDKVGSIQNALQCLPIISAMGLRLGYQTLVEIKGEHIFHKDARDFGNIWSGFYLLLYILLGAFPAVVRRSVYGTLRLRSFLYHAIHRLSRSNRTREEKRDD